jgi:putative selenate reductase
MELDEFDASGRRGIKPTGATQDLEFDTVINAVGAQVETELFAQNGIALDGRGFAELDANNQTSIAGVYIAGDCKAGPQTVVKAMADAKLIAKDILARLELEPDFIDFEIEVCRDELLAKKGILAATPCDKPKEMPLDASPCRGGHWPPTVATGNAGGQWPPLHKPDVQDDTDSARCLGCNAVCDVCVDVCPNRANVAILTDGRYQIVHLDNLCNECGNCATFCPTAGSPYKDKFTAFITNEDFLDSTNCGFLPLVNGEYMLRLKDGNIIEVQSTDLSTLPDFANIIRTLESDYTYLLDRQIGAAL